mmetsp:Transcript_22173/g.48352  ORF Transcript_22173/g.48352 Transcript_22173/m.48352 type:complete len:203 (+) Transcript_22173:803-1411(+)
MRVLSCFMWASRSASCLSRMAFHCWLSRASSAALSRFASSRCRCDSSNSRSAARLISRISSRLRSAARRLACSSSLSCLMSSMSSSSLSRRSTLRRASRSATCSARSLASCCALAMRARSFSADSFSYSCIRCFISSSSAAFSAWLARSFCLFSNRWCASCARRSSVCLARAIRCCCCATLANPDWCFATLVQSATPLTSRM